MSGQIPCCNSVGEAVVDDVIHTIINIGGFARWYVPPTGPNPFELRTFQSSDGSASITENADNIDIVIPAVVHTILNIGGFARWYVPATGPNPFELRTAQSSDGSVTITENADNIDFVVNFPVPAAHKVFQEDSTASLLTDSDTFVILDTLPGDAKVLEGETWRIEMDLLVCVPHGLGSTLTNSEVQWSIETSPAVFSVFDFYSSRDQISIVGNEKSQPQARSKKHIAQMDAPRMLVEVRRTTNGNADFLWEEPRWGGDLIEVAP